MLCCKCNNIKNKSDFIFNDIFNSCLNINEIEKSDLFYFCKKRNFNLSKFKMIHHFIDDRYNYDISWKAKLYLYVNNMDKPKMCYCGNPTTFISKALESFVLLNVLINQMN